MAFREVRVFEVREVLRLWLGGEGLRSISRLAGMDRKTVRRYVEAAEGLGLDSAGGEDQLTDEFVGGVVERVRPHRTDGHGEAWRLLDAHRGQLKTWLVDDELTVVKAHELLERQGVVVPQRTVHRYALDELGVGRSARSSTVRVSDGEPGDELQVDFGKLGRIADPDTGKMRDLWALVFTPVVSRFTFVWLTHRQTIDDVISGFEAAWVFYGGIFATVIPDNLKAIVDRADPLDPRLNRAFVEYAQARGFKIDPARVRKPQDKPRVERTVSYVRNSFFAGENFIDLPDAQRRAEVWCRERAGMRIHGTIQVRPAEVFRLEELPVLAPAPTAPYDLPVYATAKVHRDHHIEVAKALYSVPGNLIGTRVDVRADRRLVRIFSRGQLVKIHPRQKPGSRSTDPEDLPSEKNGVCDAGPRQAATYRRLTWRRDRRLDSIRRSKRLTGRGRTHPALASALGPAVRTPRVQPPLPLQQAQNRIRGPFLRPFPHISPAWPAWHMKKRCPARVSEMAMEREPTIPGTPSFFQLLPHEVRRLVARTSDFGMAEPFGVERAYPSDATKSTNEGSSARHGNDSVHIQRLEPGDDAELRPAPPPHRLRSQTAYSKRTSAKVGLR